MSQRSMTLACAFAAAASMATVMSARGGDVISQLTDPVQAECEGFVDIINAWIEQEGGLLTFVIETRESIPSSIPYVNEQITFLWLVDADNDPDTGQPHEQLGTEFNVRVCISELFGGGLVDVTGELPGGGCGTVLIEDNRVQIAIGLSQIAYPSQFHWGCDAFHAIDDVAVSANHETDVAIAETLPYTPPARVRVITPLLMLCPAGPATGQLEVEILDSAGNTLPTGDYHLAFQSSNEAVATVDATGAVTAHAVPVLLEDTPYVEVRADGLAADNFAVIRVTETDLGIAHQTFGGASVAFYLPPIIEGVDLDQLTADYQIVEATDLAYAAQLELMDQAPSQGGTQYFVLDVTDDPATVPCGLSGNPVRLGWHYDVPVHNSCFIINDPDHRVPQWAVYFHEMGHDFTLHSWGFVQFCTASDTHGWKYTEAFASMAGAWSWYRLTRCPSEVGPANVASIAEHFPNIDPAGRLALLDYQATGANYADITVGVICDILWDMYDDYTAQVWYDVFSTFVPADEPLPCILDTDAKQATWLVAAISASVGTDLRARFGAEYGFPIDNEAWPELLAAVQSRIGARPWQGPWPADFDCDWDVDFYDFIPLCDCLTVPDAGLLQPVCECADFDRDVDVDLVDVLAFQAAFTGS